MSGSRRLNPTSARRLWTPANVVTLVRICLVPVFVAALVSPWPQWFGLPQVADDAKSLVAAGIFILISCTDWLDGYLARSRGEVTDFGKFMDPLADKILVCAALLALIELGALPSWVVLVILTREFIVSGVRMVAANEGVVIAASWYGKAKTVFQMVAIVLFCVKDSHMAGSVHAALSDWMWTLSWLVMLVALVLTVVSMLDYIAKARRLLGLGRGGRAGEGDVADVADEELSRLAAAVLDAARAAGRTLGTAESLTGGLAAAALTAVPGSSETVRGGVVSYASEVKSGLLDVDPSVIASKGAVSRETALAMAKGARERLGCDVAVSMTGIAGPGGAEPGKPVGTVWLACCDERGGRAEHRLFSGTREQVRRQTVRAALELALDALEAR